MPNKKDLKLLKECLSLPTAPFTEEHVREYFLKFCRERDVLTVREDAVGNIRVHYRHPNVKRSRPVCLCGHMDHPGFRAVKMLDDTTLKARWMGHVLPEYFPNAKVRFYSEGNWIKGQVRKTQLKTLGLEKPEKSVDTAEIVVKKAVQPNAPGMWDFPDPAVKGRHIHARGCDDIAGCSAILSCIDTLVRTKAKTEAYFLFTRAEEVGFIGAIAACRRKTIPQKCVIVAVETSSVIPGVEMGKGPILRVGDKSSIFTPELTAWCQHVAEHLAKKDKGFKYQRKLMDGGSCESTAYCELGYQATGLCIALGNYHNCDRVKKKLASEFIHLEDWDNLVKWFVALTTEKAEITSGNPRVKKRLHHLERKYQRMLSRTV